MVESKVVEGGRFRIFKNGEIRKIKDGVEKPAFVRTKKVPVNGTKPPRHYRFVSYKKDDGKVRSCYIGRMLAEAFIPNPDNARSIVFIDGNPLNDSLDNIRWATKNDLKTRNGTKLKSKETERPPKGRGISASSKRKIDEELASLDLNLLTPRQKQVVQKRLEYKTIDEIGFELDISSKYVSSTIRQAIDRHKWKSKM